MNKKLHGASTLLAALEAKEFMRRHGASLSELLYAIGGNRALDLYCEADRFLDDLSPDPMCVGKTFQGMRDLLVSVTTPEDRYAESLRWHGARLTDFAARLLG